MGMDLIPRNKEVESKGYNWTGWRILGDLLESMGCDLSKMAGSNDGQYIDAKTCRAWAKALQMNLDADLIRVLYVKDNAYFGGGYDKLVLYEHKTKLDLKPLPEHFKEWVLSSIKFFNECRGCRQF